MRFIPCPDQPPPDPVRMDIGSNHGFTVEILATQIRIITFAG
jgi:hypothetical protein